MSGLRAEEDKDECPDVTDGYKEIDDTGFFSKNNIGEEGGRNKSEYEREKCVAGCYIHVLKAAFALKESCKTPVCYYKECKRKEN